MCIYQKVGKCTIGINKQKYPGQKVVKCGPNCSYYCNPERSTTSTTTNEKDTVINK